MTLRVIDGIGNLSFIHLWVVCDSCNFKRHGNNAELLKRLHEENNKNHSCKVVEGSAESP